MSFLSILPKMTEEGTLCFHVRFTIDPEMVTLSGFKPHDKVSVRRNSETVVFDREPSPVQIRWRVPSPEKRQTSATVENVGLLGLPEQGYRKVSVSVEAAHDRIVIRVPTEWPEDARLPIPTHYHVDVFGMPYARAMAQGATPTGQVRALDAWRSEREYLELSVDEIVRWFASISREFKPISPRLFRVNGEVKSLAELYQAYIKRRGLAEVCTALIL